MPVSRTQTLLPDDWPPTAEMTDVRPPEPIGEVVIINDFANAQGGAAVIALQEAREFRRLGYKVTFICGDSPSSALAKLGVVQVSLESNALLDLPVWRAMAQGMHNAGAARFITQWINRYDTPRTVYHLHNWSQIFSPAVFEALRQVENRLVVTCHDFFNICPNGGFMHYNESTPCGVRPLSVPCLLSQCDRRSSAQKYWRTLRHIHLNGAARFRDSRATFTFLHDRMQAKFIDSGFAASDVVTVPNPVEAWTDKRIEAERNEGFIFVGRIGRDKGADLAIRAACAAGQKLVLIGAGEIEASEHANDRNVQFVGWRNRDEIAEIARNARALIVPSRVVEPFGLVLLEAALSGLPVIVSSHAFLASEAVALGFGKSFHINDINGLSESLIQFADDDSMIERMSRAGFEHAKSLCHTPQSWIGELTRIFRRKLSRSAQTTRLTSASA